MNPPVSSLACQKGPLNIFKRRTASVQVSQSSQHKKPQRNISTATAASGAGTHHSLTSPARSWSKDTLPHTPKRVHFAEVDQVFKYDPEPIGKIVVIKACRHRLCRQWVQDKIMPCRPSIKPRRQPNSTASAVRIFTRNSDLVVRLMIPGRPAGPSVRASFAVIFVSFLL
ncbi:hypothetical protein V1514DRAFT_319179 [Lipomyces japonicus]|uniref:uncharacterized protein n=1 Tax=Lipomyces japonicus TaxID=56871 RepID=UPI0034CFB305